MKRLVFFLSFVFLAACEDGPARLGSVWVALTSEVIDVPYTAEELADPKVQSSIELCEAIGGLVCGAKRQPKDNLSKFARGSDTHIYTFLRLGQMEPDQNYVVDWHLINTENKPSARTSATLNTPSEWLPIYTMDVVFRWGAVDQDWQLGRWSVKIFVNGELESERHFEVVESLYQPAAL